MHLIYIYIIELIIFITLSIENKYYPPFEIKYYINKLKNNNCLIPIFDNISDDITTQLLFKKDITIYIKYGVNMKRLTISNSINLDKLKIILYKEFNINNTNNNKIIFSNEILLENITIGEYFIEDGYSIYLQELN